MAWDHDLEGKARQGPSYMYGECLAEGVASRGDSHEDRDLLTVSAEVWKKRALTLQKSDKVGPMKSASHRL